jgi:hypothetical protein
VIGACNSIFERYITKRADKDVFKLCEIHSSGLGVAAFLFFFGGMRAVLG